MNAASRLLITGLFTASLFGLQAPANGEELNIVSSDGWKSNDCSTPADCVDWQTIGFDDSSWPTARAPYPNPTPPANLIPGTTAEMMWHDPAGSSNGTTGPLEAFFRYTFNVDCAPIAGEALIAVDDDFEFFVNGDSVFLNDDDGFATIVHEVDFGSYLRLGKNVFAIQAVDGGWNNVRDRSYEFVLLDATISLPLSVAIDIKPGSDPNSINLGSAGVVPVAILSTEEFDATVEIDPDTVSLAGAGVRLVGKSDRLMCRPELVNEDDYLDLVCHVETAQFMISPGESIAVLDAKTMDGMPVCGQDSIRIVPD